MQCSLKFDLNWQYITFSHTFCSLSEKMSRVQMESYRKNEHSWFRKMSLFFLHWENNKVQTGLETLILICGKLEGGMCFPKHNLCCWGLFKLKPGMLTENFEI